MRRILIAITLVVSLGGCALLQRLESDVKVITSATVSPQAIVIAANSFNALEASATNYLRLVKCNGTNGPVCRDPAVTAKIIPLVRTGRSARDGLIAFSRNHPGELGAQGLYDALTASISGLQAIISQYGNH